MSKSTFAATVIVMLIFSGLAGTPQLKAAKTIVVPDDYPLIQDAIDGATAGDTIFVKSGVYYETLEINKSLTLIGEDREHTIIDAHKITTNVVEILANDVTLTNFTLGHTGYIFSSGATPPSGVYIEAANANVTRNTIVSVHGPAFRFGFNSGSDANFRDNIVSSSSIIAYGITYREPSTDEAVEVTDMPSPFPPDISVLEGNEVLELTRTKGASFGDLVLKDNATLIVDNFVAKAQSLKASNNSRIILVNDSFLYVHQISGGTPMRIYFMDNASLNSTDSGSVRIVCRNDSQVWARNSTLDIEASGTALVELDNCTSRVSVRGNANVTVTNSDRCIMRGMADEAQFWVSNSYVHSDGSSVSVEDKSNLWIVNSTYAPTDASFKGESNAWLINSTAPGGRYWSLSDNSNLWVINSTWQQKRYLSFYNQSNLWFINSNLTTNEAQEIRFRSAEAKVSYCWYLSVNVESSEGAPLENMNVEVYYSNGTLVDEATTDPNGNAQFILARRIWQNETTNYFVPHIIKAYSADFEEVETRVDLDSNKEVTLTVNINTPSQTEPEPEPTETEPTETEPTEHEPTEPEPTEPEPTEQELEVFLILSIISIAVAAATALLILFRNKRQK
jgi:hypothetical protein